MSLLAEGQISSMPIGELSIVTSKGKHAKERAIDKAKRNQEKESLMLKNRPKKPSKGSINFLRLAVDRTTIYE